MYGIHQNPLSKMTTQIFTRFRITPDGSGTAIVQARSKVRALAEQLGFPPPRVTLATTVVAELARNIAMYAQVGDISLGLCNSGRLCGVSINAIDEGPGIANLELALLCGYSTSGSAGYGLPGISRIADEFHIDSGPGKGTTVNVILWRDRQGAKDLSR